MSTQIRYEKEDTDLVISSISNADLGKFYYANDTDETYVGLADGSVAKVGEQSALTVYSDTKKYIISTIDDTIAYTTTDNSIDLSTLMVFQNTLNVSNTDLANGQITIPTTGDYRISICAKTNSNNDNWAKIEMHINGVTSRLRTTLDGISGSSALTKTGYNEGYFSLSSGDLLQFNEHGSDGNTFDTVIIVLELINETIISGFNFLTDTTPNTETLTGELFNGKPVYRQSLSGLSWGASGVWALGADSLVRVGGYVSSSSSVQYPFPFNDNPDSAHLTLDTTGNFANTLGSGVFVGNPYHIFADYTKP